MDLTVINAGFASRENGPLGLHRVRMDFTEINAGFASHENGPYSNQRWVCIAWKWTLPLSTLILDRVGMDFTVNYVHTVDYKTACISYFFFYVYIIDCAIRTFTVLARRLICLYWTLP